MASLLQHILHIRQCTPPYMGLTKRYVIGTEWYFSWTERRSAFQIGSVQSWRRCPLSYPPVVLISWTFTSLSLHCHTHSLHRHSASSNTPRLLSPATPLSPGSCSFGNLLLRSIPSRTSILQPLCRPPLLATCLLLRSWVAADPD